MLCLNAKVIRMKRKLTTKEIDNLVDFIKPNALIPPETANSVMIQQKQRLIKQLVKIEVHPEIIPKLKEEIELAHETSLIAAGECVGIVCAQSIGHSLTQKTLDSFHRAGLTEKAMVVGVPRCKELLSATSKPKTKVSRIFFKSDANGELKDLRDTIGHSIVGLTFNDISVEMIAVLDKEPEPWYDLFSILYEDKFGNLDELEYTNCIDVTLDMEKLYGYRLSLPDIANVVVGEYRDVAVVFSPPSIGKMHIYFDTNGITLPPERAYYNGTEETPFIYLEEVVIPILEKFTITGIPGISNIFYNKQDGEWIAEADGSNLQGLMAHPLVDDTRTM